MCVCVHLTYIITNFKILSKLRDLGKCRLLILIENKKLCFFNILKYFQVLACDDPGYWKSVYRSSRMALPYDVTAYFQCDLGFQLICVVPGSLSDGTPSCEGVS